MIKAIVDQTGCAIDIADDGTVSIASPDSASVLKAIEIIKTLTMTPEVGETYKAKVVRIEQYNDAGITPSYTLGIGTGNTGLVAAQLPGISASDLAVANNLLATLGGYITSSTQTFNVSSRTSGFTNGYTNLRHDTLDNYALYVTDSWKLRP